MSCSCRLFGLTLCLAGLALSLYAYYVEVMMEASGGEYEALCDVSERVSCTKVFNTSFAKGFGLVDKVVGEFDRLDSHCLTWCGREVVKKVL